MPRPRRQILALQVTWVDLAQRVSLVSLSMVISMLLAISTTGCQKRRREATKLTAAQAPPRLQEAPPEVTSYLGLRNPQSSLDNLLGIVRELAPSSIPIERNGILDLLVQRARLPMDVLPTIDFSGNFWMVTLDERQLGPADRDPSLFAFPLRSRQQFEDALGKHLQKTGSEGGFVRYAPKPGAVGVRELRLLFSARYVLVPSSRRVLEICLPFVQRNLLPRPPSYALVMHVLAEHLHADTRQDLRSQLGGLLRSMRSHVPPASGLNSIDRVPVAKATEEAVRYYGEVLDGVRELIITAEVSSSQLTASVRAEGKPRGLLQRLIKRQKPGPIFGQELLPQSTWLVLSNRSNPEAAAERQRTWVATVRAMFRKLEPRYGERFRTALVELGRRATGDVTMALHRPPSGTGLALTVLAELHDGGQTGQAMEKLADVGIEWLRHELRNYQQPGLSEIKFIRQPFSRAGAKGSICSLELQYPEARRRTLERLLGQRVGLGWAVKGDLAMVVVGKDAEEQLASMAEGIGGGKPAEGLAATAAFRRAHSASPMRTGLLYVSLIELARWFEGSGLPETDAMAGVLSKARFATAPSLDWGVNATRTQLDVTLHLPIEHFRSFKPVFEEFLKKRAEAASLAPWTGPDRIEPP